MGSVVIGFGVSQLSMVLSIVVFFLKDKHDHSKLLLKTKKVYFNKFYLVPIVLVPYPK